VFRDDVRRSEISETRGPLIGGGLPGTEKEVVECFAEKAGGDNVVVGSGDRCEVACSPENPSSCQSIFSRS